ncbi:MAG TPA: hypothetical protein VGI70_20815, partial [Polyangiales bacterium]
MRTRAWLLIGCVGAVWVTGCNDDDKKTSSHTGAESDEDSGAASSTTTKIDRSGLSDVGLASTPLDYSDPRLWLCRP